MHGESRDVAADTVEPEFNDLDAFTSYQDDGDHVVCETENPTAWIRSDVTEPVNR